MSDEVPQTADGAIRVWLAAVGFTLVLIGGEMMAEKDGSRFNLGAGLVIAALPVHLAWVFWTKIKPHLGAGVLAESSVIATSPRWWFGMLFVALTALVMAPTLQVPRWPSWPRSELSTIPTSLKLQFNAKGTAPQEIERKNVEWKLASPTENRLTGKKEQKLCEPLSITAGSTFLGNGQSTPRCNTIEIPEYTDVTNWIIFLSFVDPIAAKEIKINGHGATLPKYEVSALTEHGAYIFFHGDLTRMVIDFQIVN
jgi:hypothetical protein